MGSESLGRFSTKVDSYPAPVGESRIGNKKIPTRTKTYHGDVHLREGISDLRTLVDRTAEALVNAVDVVVQLRYSNHRRPTIRSDLAPHGRHLRVQHTYSSTMISAFLI